MSRNQAHCSPESSILDSLAPDRAVRTRRSSRPRDLPGRATLHRPRWSPGTRTFDVGQNRRVQFAHLGQFLFQSRLREGKLVHGAGAYPASEEAHVNEKFLGNWVPRAEPPERRGGVSRQAPPTGRRLDSSPSGFRLLELGSQQPPAGAQALGLGFLCTRPRGRMEATGLSQPRHR